MRTLMMGSADRPNGFFGEKIRVFLAFDPDTGYLLEAHPYGWHRSPVFPMPFQCSAEAKWCINNNTQAKEFYSNVIYS